MSTEQSWLTAILEKASQEVDSKPDWQKSVEYRSEVRALKQQTQTATVSLSASKGDIKT